MEAKQNENNNKYSISLIVLINLLNSFREVKMSSSEEPTEPTPFEVELQTDANASNENTMPTTKIGNKYRNFIINLKKVTC